MINKYLIVALGFFSMQSYAQKIDFAKSEIDVASVNSPVSIFVGFAGDVESYNCGLEISYGDGSKELIRVVNDEVKFGQIMRTHLYQGGGQYTITVGGKMIFRGIKTVAPCVGDDRKFVVRIVDQAAKEMKNEAQRQLQDVKSIEAELRQKELDLLKKEQDLRLKEKEQELKLKEEELVKKQELIEKELQAKEKRLDRREQNLTRQAQLLEKKNSAPASPPSAEARSAQVNPVRVAPVLAVPSQNVNRPKSEQKIDGF